MAQGATSAAPGAPAPPSGGSPPGAPAPPSGGSPPGAPPRGGRGRPAPGNPGPLGPGSPGPGPGGGCEKPRSPRSGEAPPGGGVPPAGGGGSGARGAAACPKARRRNMVRTARLGRGRSLGGTSGPRPPVATGIATGGGIAGAGGHVEPLRGRGPPDAMYQLLFGPTGGARIPGAGGMGPHGAARSLRPVEATGWREPARRVLRRSLLAPAARGGRSTSAAVRATTVVPPTPVFEHRSTIARSAGGSSCLACQASSKPSRTQGSRIERPGPDKPRQREKRLTHRRNNLRAPPEVGDNPRATRIASGTAAGIEEALLPEDGAWVARASHAFVAGREPAPRRTVGRHVDCWTTRYRGRPLKVSSRGKGVT
jgi:hypothetical protein